MRPAALVDIGCNLTSPRLMRDLDRVLREARAAGVTQQVLTGTDPTSNAASLELAEQHADLFATAGHHPHHANDWQPNSHPAALQAIARMDRVVAVGEMGLDYHRNFAKPVNQRRCFRDQLAVAATVGKPVFLHERDAYEDFIAILRPMLPELPGAVWHCFTGSSEALETVLDLGLYIGITGWICDPVRGEALREQVKVIPDDRLMVETDAPYLTPKTLQPTPRTNEPKYLGEVVSMLAQCRGQTPEHIASITTTNARQFFGLNAQ
ncbi:TatD family hydrolase [Suttonella sp. R2A3]|uniref:TatD family hydrolase n=1 Tax=Suttonella sp. R2A3 TaxID=2908648 RepID=UPI001F36BD07|nr:TatD family hydrolase [Suttonella sp. R2A3]UJF24649.1 TatD family hydrolase [Suttonella sp. R2A3]